MQFLHMFFEHSIRQKIMDITVEQTWMFVDCSSLVSTRWKKHVWVTPRRMLKKAEQLEPLMWNFWCLSFCSSVSLDYPRTKSEHVRYSTTVILPKYNDASRNTGRNSVDCEKVWPPQCICCQDLFGKTATGATPDSNLMTRYLEFWTCIETLPFLIFVITSFDITCPVWHNTHAHNITYITK